MAEIVCVVLKGAIGLLVKEGRRKVVEKLKDGDIAQEELRSWIVNEIDNINSKLDALAKKDLGASISHYKDGLVFLYEAIDTKSCDDSNSVTTPGAVGRQDDKMETFLQAPKLASSGVNMPPLVEEVVKEVGKLDLNNLNESGMKKLLEAKKSFYEARKKSIEAFNNEALTPLDRVLAMVVRLTAIILENVENPSDALAVCRSALKELHLLPFVRENFKVELKGTVKSFFNTDKRREIISSVCEINRIVYDVTVMVGKKEEMLLLPCVEIGNEKVDLLRDSRVAKLLCKLEMGDCSVVWSFGQEEEEKNKQLNSVISVATNNLGQFLVADNRDRCIKVFDFSGKFLYSFGLPSKDPASMADILAVTTDNDDNIYVLVNSLQGFTRTSHIYVFDKQANFSRRFLASNSFMGNKVKVTDKYVIVTGRFRRQKRPTASCNTECDHAMVYKKDGTRIGDISKSLFCVIPDITTGKDGTIIMLDNNSQVSVFDIRADNDDDVEPEELFNPSVSHLLREFPVAKGACAIAFHCATRHVVIASQTSERRQVLLYCNEGKLEHSIDIELERRDKIKAIAVTTDGHICVLVRNIRGRTSKVLVL